MYSSSLLLLGLARFPVAPGPANQARHGTRQKMSTTRLGLGHPALVFVQKLKPFLVLLKNLFTVNDMTFSTITSVYVIQE